MPRPRPRRHRRQVIADRMNKTEHAYSQRLDLLKAAGQVVRWEFEPLNFRLAPRTYYRPDFLVVTDECMEVHEVKGFWEDDAKVKFKVAAEMYPEFRWCWVRRDGKGWEVNYAD